MAKTESAIITDVATVTMIPALAISVMLKYPVEYVIRFVGDEVTRINARDKVKDVGSKIPLSGISFVSTRAIITGIIMAAVTVLLENPTFISETTITITKI